jgi:predicted Fe-S protein YdhL (DUF1289 family)
MIHPETRYCLGCGRSIDEISRWSRMTPEERHAILADLPERRPAPDRRRGGAMARRAVRREPRSGTTSDGSASLE